MIVRPRLHWLRMLFVWRGQLITITVLAIAVTVMHGQIYRCKVQPCALALESLGAEIEESFGQQANHLALDAMSAMIKAMLGQAQSAADGPTRFVQT